MTELFLKIVNMSFSASWLILAVLLLRVVLRDAPKWIRVLLWGMVAVRLILPFSVESMFSLVPSVEVISRENPADHGITIQTGVEPIDAQMNQYFDMYYTDNTTAPKEEGVWESEEVSGALEVPKVTEEESLPVSEVTEMTGISEGQEESGTGINTTAQSVEVFHILAGIWVMGMVLLVCYSVISYFCLHSKVRTAVRHREHIFQSENVTFPFVLGLFHPRIYVPFGLETNTYDCVIAHEQAHIKRLDHLWKPLGFLLLTVYWFHPLMWLAYMLLCRDIELACDERVIREWNQEQIADYAQALLVCSVNNSRITACPVAFSEVSVKDRVKAMTSYKKPAFWVIVLSIVLCIVVAVCFLTNPKTEEEQPQNAGAQMEHSDEGTNMTPDRQQGEINPAEEGSSGNSSVNTGASGVDSENGGVNTGASGVDSNGGNSIPVTGNGNSGLEIEETPVFTPLMEFGSADLDGDGWKETFRVSEITFDRYQLDVLKADGSVLWGEEYSTAHVGWNSFFLCHLDGKDYLLRYNPTMYQGFASYYYELCRIEDGALKVVEKDSVDFSSNPGEVLTSEQRAYMRAFAKRVNELLSTSVVLLSTEEGVLEYGGGPADSYKEYYDVLGDLGALLMEQSDEEDTLNVSISGYFVATVRDILPDYLGDDFTPAVAVVQIFQGEMFTIGVRDLAEQLEIGKTYVFEIEEKNNIELGWTEYDVRPLAPAEVILDYNIRIKAVREIEEGEGGLDSSHLYYKLEK